MFDFCMEWNGHTYHIQSPIIYPPLLLLNYLLTLYTCIFIYIKNNFLPFLLHLPPASPLCLPSPPRERCHPLIPMIKLRILLVLIILIVGAST